LLIPLAGSAGARKPAAKTEVAQPID